MSLFQSSNIETVSLVDWLDWASGTVNDKFIALPMIQRGSVWQPNQIIDLWDSLLMGMPIGSLMVCNFPEGTLIRRPGATKSETVPAGGGLGLIDGHQRTLAMLIAWPEVQVDMDRKIWIDFADTPAPGQLLRLRVTTRNQPFGFQRNEPSRKLSLNDRRNAYEAFNSCAEPEDSSSDPTPEAQSEPTLETACPFSYEPGLPVDLRDLVKRWKNNVENSECWRAEVLSLLKEINGSKYDRTSGKWIKVKVWETLEEEQKKQAQKRVDDLIYALDSLFCLEIPLIRVDERFLKVNRADSDPLLAILFKRIGSGGTPLSNADYVYSVIKHLRPQVYDLVENLHAQRNVASLLTATDLVMSAVRLAAITWSPKDGNPVQDLENPSMQDFQRLLLRGDFIDEKFLPLIQTSEKNCEINELFHKVQNALTYKVSGDIGLPTHAFPLLKRPLVQVLLRLAQKGYLDGGLSAERRIDVLRLVLFWLVAVTDPSKASRLAYQIISGNENNLPYGLAIHDRLIEREEAAVPLPLPKNIEGLVCSPDDTEILRGLSRFNSKHPGDGTHEKEYAFYRNRWWRPWTYQHPILLWIQREMVAHPDKLGSKGDPMAGKDEDTPYDYDHILPYAHWGNWTGVKHGERLPDFADQEREIWVVGNSIGNVRVWASTLNRSDGDKSPTEKLKLDVNDSDQEELLKDSAIDNDQIGDWKIASGDAGKQRTWSRDRALSFQKAVETRAFQLYKRYHDDLGFSEWYERDRAASDPGSDRLPEDVNSPSLA